ncbi:hypothetical protein WME79_41930 [Sorangium sp. So ce726]|uniref:hypothetical protein n=1 Tax=Sorangium sp. So ce726 TaxID=3133319 RepID=UPI003F5DC218
MRRRIRSSRRRWGVAAALSGLLAPALASAQEPPPPPGPPAPAPLPSPPPGAYAWAPQGPLPEEPAPESSRPELPEGWRRGFGAKLHAGGSWQSFYSLAIYGASFGAAAGGTLDHVALWGGLEGFVGVTEFGLPARMIRPSFEVETHLGDFRLGGGAGLLLLAVARATSTSSMTSTAFGLSAHLSYDLLTVDRHALYLAGRMNVDLASAILWGPSGSLGFRY